MSSINSRVPPLRLMAVDTPSDGQLPSYQSSSGKFEWVDESSGGSPGGSNNEIQFNNSGAFGGDAGFVMVDKGGGNSTTIKIGEIKIGNTDIENETDASDLEITTKGTGGVDFKNSTSNANSTVYIRGNGTGTPILNLLNDTKSITLRCNDNQKLTVEGGTETFIFDCSTASGGITFPDGTTQTTAASGTVTGSGTANQLSYWSGTSAITGSTEFTIDASAGDMTVTGQIVAGDYILAGGGQNEYALTSSGEPITITPSLGVNTGSISISEAADGDITITPDGTGKIQLDGLAWPNADGSANQVLATDGAGTLSFADASGVSFPLQGSNGSSSAPTYSFSGDTDTGIYLAGTNNLALCAGNANYLYIGSLGSVQFEKKALFNAATEAAPNAFATDTNTGFFLPSADNIGFSTGGTERFRFGSSGEILVGGTAAGTSGQVLTSGGSGSAVSWTTVSGGANPSIATSMDSAYDMYMLTSLPPFTRGVLTSSTQSITTSPIFIPFIAPINITGVAFEVNITGTGASSNLLMCLYDADTSTGTPTSKVSNSEVTIDATSTGYKTATFSSTIELTKDTVYWIALCSDNNNITVRAHASDNQMPVGLINGMDNFNKAIIKDTVASGSLPASITDANLETSYIFAPLVGLQV